ncbi:MULTISPECIES: 3-oxoacyl-[acyl-carrier-protein] synthase III C-terminal domain-containing protein [unclassified Streptomyces]|uniref:3-oxoacyl-[acyl-carrier-protein] synthase III C-terminal domain-containing protein n=1 Tax=unclassified Streptomyces TaxID=2593676 RepID=UPI0033EF2167
MTVDTAFPQVPYQRVKVLDIAPQYKIVRGPVAGVRSPHRGLPTSACRQDGRAPHRWATAPDGTVTEARDRAGGAPGGSAALVQHQTGRRIIDVSAQHLRPVGVAIVTGVESGNTTTAAVPLTLTRTGHYAGLADGDEALLFDCGGGLSLAGQTVAPPTPSASMPTGEVTVMAGGGSLGIR